MNKVEESPLFHAVCKAMADPAFYPGSVTRVQRIDTHISVVFLTGAWVYKLKKPLDMGFLDFRALEDRRRFCETEVSLNRRLSQGVYQEVLTIYENNNRFSLEENGRAVEYAVKMRQLPEAASLKELLKKNKISRTHIKNLGLALADFHDQSRQSSRIDHYGRRDVISANVEENFRQLEPFAGAVLDPEEWEFICQVNRSFLEIRRALFDHRVETGRIRDGHGDLRAEHIYFYQGLQIIDCIEFNDRFRYGDVVLDLAFLHMDLEHLGYPEWSLAFLAEYAARSHDLELYALLDFYAAYRSIVRLKVSCLRSLELEGPERRVQEDEARLFMKQTYRYAIQFSRPALWLFCGLPATGKSSLAVNAAKTLSIPLFQSDAIRGQDRPEDAPKVVPFGQGLYRANMRGHVYAQMLALAQEALKGGLSVILDATFAHRHWRDEARRLAADLDTNLVAVECVCPKETIISRLRRRETEPGLSDARLRHFQQISAGFEPINELTPNCYFTVNTNQPLSEALSKVLSEGYARQCAQVKKIL